MRLWLLRIGRPAVDPAPGHHARVAAGNQLKPERNDCRAEAGANWRRSTRPSSRCATARRKRTNGYEETQVAIGYAVEGRGPMKLAGPLLAALGKRALAADSPRLKELLEARL